MNRIASIKSNVLAPVSSDSWSENFVLDKELKDVAGYADYLISPDGDVYSRKGRTLRKMKHHQTNKGYSRVTIVGLSGRKNVYIHRLVAKGFLPPYEGESIHHVNFIRSDNRSSNLRWVTTKYNLANKRSRLIDCVCIHGKKVRHNQIGLKKFKEFKEFNDG